MFVAYRRREAKVSVWHLGAKEGIYHSHGRCLSIPLGAIVEVLRPAVDEVTGLTVVDVGVEILLTFIDTAPEKILSVTPR